MNDAADEPSKPTSPEPEFREISEEELLRILENHKRWVEAEDKSRLDHLRADLSWADLRGQASIGSDAKLEGASLNEAQLQGANLYKALLWRANLNSAQLQGAVLEKAQLRQAKAQRAQLQGAVLIKAELHGAELYDARLVDANLYNAQLPAADLRKSWLQRANLNKANLTGANLNSAHLWMAQLKGADLQYTELQEAILVEAQLQGANLYKAQLQGASLYKAQLQGANLYKAQLQGANLYKAQLQGALLHEAQFRRAELQGANFERLAFERDGVPVEERSADQPFRVLVEERSADLTDADFRDADLSNAQLSTVTGLRAEMLAGAVLTNAKLPDDIKSFDQLKHVEETSRNATTVFFGLLAASLYSWLTIATTTDVALITGTASSPLPIINTNIALSGFYLAAPLILIAVYFYFHLYLQRLWGDLATLPAVFQDGAPLDRKAYPWLLNGLVRAHFKKLEVSERPLTRVENVVSILLAWWVVPFTLLAFWLRYLPRHDWWGTGLHVALIAAAAWFGVYSYRLAVRTLSGGATATEEEKEWRSRWDGPSTFRHERGDQPLPVRIWRTVRRHLPSGMETAGAGVAIVVVLSAGAWIDPGHDLPTMLGYETYADLRDDDVSTKPSGWTGRDEAAAVEVAQVKGADLEGRDLRDADARGAFLVNAKLEGADLSGAILFFADLRGADLPHAKLSDANLSRAHLSSAHLSGADLSGAHLSSAHLSGADLRGAHLSGADLRRANLADANLAGANLAGANLTGANLTDADLSEADLRGANLREADLSPADLSGADLRDADFLGADLRGAFLGDADLTGAYLYGAYLYGAYLRGARHLTQEQLDGACGDDTTQLPKGLTIRTCPVAAPPASPSPPPGSS